uniref:Transmembrane protein n=1 Tax=Macrostomum lignano TaxID=282301 RepID=A0A1I8FMS5_9PLAT
MAAQCTRFESDFDQSLASCFGLLGSGIPMATPLPARKLTAFKDCQDGILNNSSQHWSGCPWYKKKLVLRRPDVVQLPCRAVQQDDVASEIASPSAELPAQQRVPGCLLSALISSGWRHRKRTSSSACGGFECWASGDCQGRYNFAWPEYVRTNEDLFRVRTDFMMTGAPAHSAQRPEVQPAEGPVRTAALSQCDQHTNEARGLLFHRLEMQCTDYSRRRIQDLQAAWDAANRCLETAMSRQCGARAGQLFGALVRMRNTLQRFEIDCQGAYVSNNYTVEQFLIRPEAAGPGRQLLTHEYVADEGGSSGWQQQQQQQQTKGQSRDGSSKANGRRASPKSVAVAAIAAAVATFCWGFGVNSNVHSFVDKVYNGFEVFSTRFSRCQCRRACNDLPSTKRRYPAEFRAARTRALLSPGTVFFIKGDSGPVQQPPQPGASTAFRPENRRDN